MTDPTSAPHAETGVRIRKATLADREALIELARVVFAETGTEKGAELSPEFWEWQFARQPVGRMDIWVGEINGEIVAQFPTNVVRLKCGNQELLASWVIDLMVHPAHRDKALYIRVARVAHQDMGETGIGICLGLPNKKSFPAAIRFIKHTRICQVPVLVLPLRWSRLLARTGLPSWLSRALGPLAWMGHRLMRLPGTRSHGVVVKEVKEFPSAIDDLWQRASAGHRIISVRDREYLAWRYNECPTRSYKILIAESDGKLAGYLVQRVFEKDGLKLGALMDVFVEPGRKDVFQALLKKGIEWFRGQGVDAVVALMLRDNFYYQALRRRGFARVPERFNPRTFNLVCRVLHPELPKDKISDAKNWFVTMGDFDVY